MEQLVYCYYHDSRQMFVLTKDLITEEVIVPEGFESDGFSSPQMLRWFVGRTGKGWFAAWVHDYCYATECVSKKDADKLFYNNLLKADVNKIKAKALYYAVKLFGSSSYGNGE